MIREREQPDVGGQDASNQKVEEDNDWGLGQFGVGSKSAPQCRSTNNENHRDTIGSGQSPFHYHNNTSLTPSTPIMTSCTI